jgi:hypothetical protein
MGQPGELKMKSAIETALDQVELRPVSTDANEQDDGIAYVTHEGVLEFGGLAFRVYQLNTGERIIPCEDLERVFGLEQSK